jgi:hypothetical protein
MWEEAVSDELLLVCAGEEDEQGQPVFLLSAEDRGRREKEMSRRCLGCRIERL